MDVLGENNGEAVRLMNRAGGVNLSMEVLHEPWHAVTFCRGGINRLPLIVVALSY